MFSPGHPPGRHWGLLGEAKSFEEFRGVSRSFEEFRGKFRGGFEEFRGVSRRSEEALGGSGGLRVGLQGALGWGFSAFLGF